MGAKRTITPEVEAEVVRAYSSGERSGELAKRMGINRKTVTTIVRRNNGEVLKQQIASGRRPTDTTPLHPKIVELRMQGWSQSKIAREVGVSQPLVSRALAMAGMSTKDDRTGPNHPAWKGGRNKTDLGYVLVWVADDDPFASMRNRMGYVLEHRLVVARSLGRLLDPSESVHHINGNREDNRIGNLQLRQGKHGKGAAFACGDCGSRNIVPAKIEEAPMYHCAACGIPAEVRDDVLTRACDCDAAVIAEARVELHGAGGVR